MKIFSGKKDKKGFTTLEVVLVVAILAIAMAIAVPGIIRLSRNLKIAKLDDIAREIYTSAQSRTISLSVGGQLSRIEGAGNARIAAGRSEATVKYVYKSGVGSPLESEGTDILLPLGSIEEGVRQNYYIIEYNTVTAMINGVYYWENEENDFLNGGYGSINPDEKPERIGYAGGMVGYYGGEDVDGRLSDDYTSEVTTELVNDEELYLIIMQGISGSTPYNGTITVTLTDTDTNTEKEIASFRNQDYQGADSQRVIPGKEYLYYHFYKTDMAGREVRAAAGEPHFKLTLDSLKSSGLHFSELWSEDGAFRPGCNLKVTVSFQEEGKQVQEESFLTNSLFASVKGEYNDSRTAYISCGRHLENLSPLWVYAQKAENGLLTEADRSDKLGGVDKAVQTEKIDWKKSLETVGAVFGDASFRPIVNRNLIEFDGEGNTISHVDIFGDVENDVLKGYGAAGGSDDDLGIGLIGRFAGNKLQNIRLEDCTVRELTETGGRKLHIGLLTGVVDGISGEVCEISDCHAYATADAGAGAVSPCSIKAPADTDSVGGLLGVVRNTKKVEKCSASLTEISGNAEYAGGLAGRVDSDGVSSGVAVSQCYADTGVWSPTGWDSGLSVQSTATGGLLGYVEGSSSFTMENSYAAGWVSDSPASSHACGLVGDAAGTGGARSVRSCYAALLQGNDNDIVAELVPAGSGFSETDCINYSGRYDDFDTLTEPYVTGTAPSTTHAYGILVHGALGTEPAYPFPRLEEMPHYGDWPEEESSEVLMAYYEVYEKDGAYSIGFYNNPAFNTLKEDESHTVVRDGYAVMFPVSGGRYGGMAASGLLGNDAATGDPNLVVSYNDHEVHHSRLKLRDASEKFSNLGSGSPAAAVAIEGINGNQEVRIESKDYYPLFLSSAMMVEGLSGENETVAADNGRNGFARHGSYYQKFEVEVKGSPVIQVWFNPYVAKSDFVTAASAPKAPAVSILRTPRQITAYTTTEAMKKTAIGDSTDKKEDGTPGTGYTHTLRLERNINLRQTIGTDNTIPLSKIESKDLMIPDGKDEATDETGAAVSKTNVILELNGKTLKGTGNSSVVSAYGGQLTVYGYRKDNPNGTDMTTEGTITGGGGTKVAGSTDTCGGGIYINQGVTGMLKKVTITGNTATDKSSVSINVTDGITLDGCKISKNP